jgi:peptidoglycan/LPS O-acetylase OafA/YrhL
MVRDGAFAASPPDQNSLSLPSTDWVIEAWRGVAAWMVVYAHFWAFSGSDWPPLRLTHTGVNLFFVVSGFVFAPYLLGRALNGKAHAVRRFFRLYPAYLLALAVYVAMKASAGQPLRYLGEHLSFLHVQSKEMAFYYNPPFWSLPAEVEFYLLLPLLAGAAGAAQRRWGALGPLRLLMGLLVLAAGLRWALGLASDGQVQNGAFIALHHLPGVLVEFLLGAAAWKVSQRSLSPKVLISLAVSGLAGWWWLAVWFGQVSDAGVDASALKGLIGATTAVCFAALVAGTAGAAAATGGARPGQAGHTSFTGLKAVALWAGRLSYGVYLFHIAALRLAEGWAAAWGWTPGGARWLAVALTLAIAAVVYLAWENPWRMFGRRWAARLSSA